MDQVNEPLFDLTLETMQPVDSERILEIGFGTGRFWEKIFLRNNRLEAFGVDFSHEMVELAKENNKALLSMGKVKPVFGESDNLAFENHTFDKVYCNMVVYFWDQPEPHLREIHRVLKPGGRFYTGMRTKSSMRQFPFTEYGFNLFTEQEWIAILEENGFKFRETNKRSDPVIEDDDRKIRLDSLCIVAEKS